MQQDLFSNQEEPKKDEAKTPRPVRENEFLWNQFIKLGEMMGDGLHYESDGKWIEKEYKQLAKALIPEIAETYKARRKRKALQTDESMTKLLEEKKCTCGGKLVQARSGSKVAYCSLCNARYKAITKKNK